METSHPPIPFDPQGLVALAFLYFSVITQGTVGYGDMIPNSTLVRTIVVAQVLSSYFILIVLVNLVITTPHHSSH
jgi:uncharacterized membrane protein